MRSTKGPEALLLASKKPRIVELVSRAASMTEDEIRALPEKPDIVKGLINLHRKAANDKRLAEAERLANMMQKSPIIELGVHERSCHVYVINSMGDGWIRSGSNLIEIKEGWHWAQLMDGIICLTNVSIIPTEETLKDLLSCSKYLGLKTFGDYKSLEADRRNRLNPTFILNFS